MNQKEKNKLLNIVALCALMENNEGILGKSPDYILEKFERYAELYGTSENWKWGLDGVRTQLVRDWAKRWLREEL